MAKERMTERQLRDAAKARQFIAYHGCEYVIRDGPDSDLGSFLHGLSADARDPNAGDWQEMAVWKAGRLVGMVVKDAEGRPQAFTVTDGEINQMHTVYLTPNDMLRSAGEPAEMEYLRAVERGVESPVVCLTAMDDYAPKRVEIAVSSREELLADLRRCAAKAAEHLETRECPPGHFLVCVSLWSGVTFHDVALTV